MINDYFLLAFKSIRHRRLRSWLTILGIVIGVAAIVALISLSLGLQSTIEEQFEAFGADRLLIAARGFQGPGTQSEGITDDDVSILERMPEFKTISYGSARPGEIEFKNEVKFPSVFGGRNGKELLEDTTNIAEGRYIDRGDDNDALIGSRVAEGLFENEIIVRNKIKIGGDDGKEFRVVGILEPVGNQQDDNTIYITLDAYREVFGETNQVDFISAQVKPGVDIIALQEKVKREFERQRGDKNIDVVTPKQILEQIGTILGVVQAVLVGIAAISLIVGGIGITNSMYTTVLERTKEIGIMKSIGARNFDILLIFLIESGLMGLVGGFFGVLLGTGISLAIGEFSTQAGFKLLVDVNPGLMLFGLFFAFIVGMISGSLPARQASKLKPVDALRHE
ncbi:ABC transporter permease [Candidatus Woesearchaeota archaeon]|nr:ABC transporter permease [Candidatus Woesearchaeota archaeon]